MIYGYLRVSSDDQDVNSQRQGVDKFAADHGWTIEQYITDAGVSGGKDPSKRNLGPMLGNLKADDVVICSEISRLGRDLYMVMDILHYCMKTGCVIYTVKDKFILGNDIQSKVLAFAFGLSAEIERQMIQQRTREGLRLRMKMGVLVGRAIGSTGTKKLDAHKDDVLKMYEWGVPVCRIAKNFGVSRDAATIFLRQHTRPEDAERIDARRLKEARKRSREKAEASYKDIPFQVVELNRERMTEAILTDAPLPVIQAEWFPEYTYEQIYDTVLCDEEFNPLYRQHGQLKVVKKRERKSKQ